MADDLRVLVLFASLPSYFPERHGVFDDARRRLPALAAACGASVVFHPKLVMDGGDARQALGAARAMAADFVLLLHGGFTMGDVAMVLSKSEFAIGFWAVPEPQFEGDIQLNGFVSLNMSLSIAAGARDLRRSPAAWYFGACDAPRFASRFATTLTALRARKAASGRRIGLIGGLAPTFYNMAVDAGRLAAGWGTGVVEIGIDFLRSAATDVPQGAVETCVAAMASRGRVATDERGMQLSARYALALRAIKADIGLDALAVSDWPALQESPGFHPGAAFSWLEEEDGVAMASEGDVLGALTQLVAIALTGRPGCIVDLCAPDPATGRLLAWHGGGGPLHLADGNGVRWIDHPMLGRSGAGAARLGAIADFRFAPGEVTLARIGRHGETVFACEARVAADGPAGFSGARGWLDDFRVGETKLGLDDLIDTVMHHGIEHHFVLMPGRHGVALAELATWAGCAWLPPVRHMSQLPAFGEKLS